MKRVAGTIGLAAAMLLAFAGPASASKPHVETDVVHYSGASSCGSFDDDFTGTTSFRSTEFANREKIKFVTHETDTNSVTGKTIAVHQAYTLWLFPDGSLRYNGQVYIASGGASKYIHDTGTVAFDGDGNITKLAGPHTVLVGGLQPFCDALS
jgi:hypothetical protein